MSFSVFNSDIILCTSDTIIRFNYKNHDELRIALPQLVIDKNLQPHNNADTETCHGITSVTFSFDGQYYAICTNRKQLCLFKSSNNCLVSNRTLVRAASKVRFTPDNDLIVADKSGDVYLYKTGKSIIEDSDILEKSEDCLILGHLSMLLDVFVTHKNDFIITADRDEKIRVSRFPNAYNIESYCLSHTKFVSNVSELPHDINILISAGGDGEFKFWNYKLGQELCSVNYNDKINAEDIKKLCEKLQEFDVATEEATALPVKHMRLMKLDDNSSIASFTFYNNSNILFYRVCGLFPNTLNIDFLQRIVVESEPLESLFYERQFWILFSSGLKVYEFKDLNCIENVQFNKSFEKLNKMWSLLRCSVNELSFYPILYKRKFDTVQEYHERKKSRLMND